MKFAAICSPDGFPLIADLGLSYHLTLAEYGNDPVYVQFYYNCHINGDFIMVDNGAAEHGKAIEFDRVISFANLIGADEIILPDVLGDSEGTVIASASQAHLVPPKHRAVVPQGETWEDWTRCLLGLVALGVSTICIAKRYERLEGGRAHALKILEEHNFLDHFNIHLLGFNERPISEIKRALAVYSDIRGVDSAAPFAYAQGAINMNEGHSSYSWGVPYSYPLAKLNALDIIRTCRQDANAYHY